MRNGIRSHSMIGVIPVRDPPHIPKLDIRQFGRQQRSCSVEMMAPRCNDEKEHSRRMFKESFQSVFSRTGPLIPSQRIAPIGLSRTMTIKPSTMKSFSGFSDVVSSPSNGPHSMEATGSGSFNGPVLRAMGTLPPLVDLAGDANARIRANKRFNMRS